MRKIEQGDRVVVVRDITRAEGPYANAGEVGDVLEMFQPHGGVKSPWYAKVAMDGKGIKTFRVTSIKHLDETTPS